MKFLLLSLVDYQTLTSDAWFDNNVEKMCSIAASYGYDWPFNTAWRRNVDSIWAAKQNSRWYNGGTNNLIVHRSGRLKQAELYVSRFDRALFDARAFNVPKRGSYELLDFGGSRTLLVIVSRNCGSGTVSSSQAAYGKSCTMKFRICFYSKGY